jgi:hypothetical protein
MDAARCLICNTKHWSREPCPATKGDARELAKSVLRQVQNEVTKTPSLLGPKLPPLRLKLLRLNSLLRLLLRLDPPLLRLASTKKPG